MSIILKVFAIVLVGFFASTCMNSAVHFVEDASIRSACNRSSIPAVYCKFRTSHNVIDRRHEWDNNPTGLYLAVQDLIAEQTVQEWSTSDSVFPPD